ncbi:PAS domain S-box protein [Pantanalinema rosaneae CENA516]|uniref:PAS domain S-box protein n=1 Tax=Pantanalinema rosaneae TaxID=1620701 RepID=UPI003D6E70E5
MPNMARFQLLPYGVALLADAIALVITWALQPILAPTFFALFYPAVMLSSLYGGLGPGLFATGLATLVSLYCFVPPVYSLLLESPIGLFRMITLVSVALMLCGLSSRYRWTKRRVEKTALKLRESQELFESFMSHSPLTAFIKDEAGRYCYVSPVVEREFDRPLAEWLGKTDFDLFPPSIAQAIYDHDQAVLMAGRAMELEEMDSRQGEDRYQMSIKFPLHHRTGRRMLAGMSLDITEWRQAQVALRESEARFNRLADTTLIGFLTWNLDGSIVDANDAFLQLLGYTRSELEAGQLHWDRMTPPEYEPADRHAIAELYELGISKPFEKEFIRKDGVRVPVLLGSTFFERSQQAGVSFVVDLTERKRAEQALKESEERYRLLAEALPQLVWTSDAIGRVTYCNSFWYEYTGLTPEQTIPLGWRTAVHPDDLMRLWEQWQPATITGASFNIECRVRAADGQYRWFLAAVGVARDWQGQITHWVGTAQDISDRKRSEQERERLLANEQAARAEAEAANRVKDEFLAVLSHELRTPLNPILGWTKLLRSRQFSAEKADQALEVIERNATLQTQLIEDLLDISRILRGKLKLDVVPVQLVPMLNAAIETIRLAAEAKSLRIHRLFEADLRPVLGDAGRLQQIIWNLLSNAVKFTPPRGEITIRLDSIVRSGVELAQITITDTGKGISPSFLPHVFDYFRQADGSTTRSFGGLGLGLAIARHLVELHGGQITAASEGNDKGATFMVYLPLVSPQTQSQPVRDLTTDVVNLSGLQVLVVDDEPDSRELIAVILAQAGAEVRTASSADEALQLLAQALPALLISDIGMPETNGYELMQQIRSRWLAPEATFPAIALTAYAGETDQQQALAAGFQRHIAKPVAPEELLRVIAILLKSSESVR